MLKKQKCGGKTLYDVTKSQNNCYFYKEWCKNNLGEKRYFASYTTLSIHQSGILRNKTNVKTINRDSEASRYI